MVTCGMSLNSELLYLKFQLILNLLVRKVQLFQIYSNLVNRLQLPVVYQIDQSYTSLAHTVMKLIKTYN